MLGMVHSIQRMGMRPSGIRMGHSRNGMGMVEWTYCVEEDESESALPVMREITWTEARDHTLS